MRAALIILLIGCCAVVTRGIRPLAEAASVAPSAKDSIEWPMAFEGQPLEQLPLTDQERAFGEGFPGELARFRDGLGRQVILRQVTRPTRKLHPSSDCLRAAGFVLGTPTVLPLGDEGELWKTYTAVLGDRSFQVRERIAETAGPRTWTEVSRWWWDASRNASAGPWLAVTVLEEGGG